MHPGRQLGVLGLIFVVLYLFVFFGGHAKGTFTDRLKPKMGLDLVGGTQATYIATQAGGAPTPEAMAQARDIIDKRVNALGVAEADVVIQGKNTIVVSLAGEAKDQLKDLGKAANMRFRLLTGTTMDVSKNALNPASPAPSAAASGAPSVAPSGAAVPKSGASAPAAVVSPSKGTGGQGGGEAVPSATPSAPSAAPSTAASAPAAPAGPAATEAPVAADITAQRAAIAKKVGPAIWAQAQRLTAPVELSTDPKAGLPYKPFSTLSPAEVAALSPQMQFNVPTISCDQLNQRPNGSIDDPAQPVVACYSSQAKVMLDPAKVVGNDISSASPQLDQQNGQWVVSLDFKSDGQKKWADLTRVAFNATSSDPCYTAIQSLYGTSVQHCAVAVVLDKEILSAPQITAVLTGSSQITGSFTAATAKQLADQLKFGAIPVTFTSGPAETISASLGLQQLQAGLLAAAIGMGLVAIYAFFYYRLLGSVIFLSLLLSGLLTFGALVFLGRTMGYTLSLAGIAGFIVSLGVAADSFVIYFERLKDEIHEGRTPRSAVPRAWHRARRTIISANTITIMCAVVLYIVSIGAVQGFAFAMGLSTVLDLVVVFLFRHPIMTMFANTKAFLSPRVSGLGRVLRRNPTEEPGSSRVKEA
ncbi:preprotein translocase subunit SecD [Actinoplanes sp. SE50]|uniref:protein translocase subunit SecD n=1 Tax=unclassified Actinoplanes TaxID=2626549 RepID=UPI00023EBC4A|nr:MULTISPECIES: protein translocase subunit SecD [unclassified Actinoplanes]AEV87413.1 Protein-export membrane protein secD [Actinoplanes sp. SE50/110]ATO85815.1 preprotein translocase subunit SecD [Actinoplanes sp. SE50]SLM03228.1 protein-export membrane protein SecD [Actinoplanes sp. SE50/110]